MVAGILVAFALQPDPAVLRRIFEEALARREREYGASDARTAQAARDLGMFLGRLGDAPGARAALAEAVRVDEAAFGAAATQTLADVAELANVSSGPQTAQLWRRASESTDGRVAARAFLALGQIQATAGDRPGAAAFYRRALTRQETAAGRDSEPVALTLNALAQVLEPTDGIPLLERALAIDRRALGARHPQTATTEANLAGQLVHAGRYTEAARDASDALSVFRETLGEDHPRCGIAASILAFALEAKGDRVQAEKMYRLALEIAERAYGAQDPRTADAHGALEEFLRSAPAHRDR